MNKLILHSLGYSVTIFSDIPIKDKFNSSLRLSAFIPNFNISQKNEVLVATIKHQQSDDQTIKYNKDEKTYYITDDWKKDIPVYIIHFIYKVFNDGYISDKIPLLVFHASAVRKHNTSVTIVTPTGGGKTSIMLDLVTNFGFKFLSNNKTIFSRNNNEYNIIGGTRAVSIRNGLIPNLRLKPVKRESFLSRQLILLDTKYYADFEKAAENVIVIPQINSEFQLIEEVDKTEAIFYLFPMALELVNREVIFFNGKKVGLNNTLSAEKKQQILNELRGLIFASRIVMLTGSLKFISNEINNLVKGPKHEQINAIERGRRSV